jgi:hypothetical protein
MTKIVIGSSQRFDGDFSLAPGPDATLAAEEKAYVDRVNDVLTELAEREAAIDAEIERLLQSLCKALAKQLATTAELLSKISDDAKRIAECRLARDEAIRLHGIYCERRDQINGIPFSVSGVEKNGLIDDIKIEVFDARIPTDKQEFKVEVDRTIDIERLCWIVLINGKVLQRRNNKGGYMSTFVHCLGSRELGS